MLEWKYIFLILFRQCTIKSLTGSSPLPGCFHSGLIFTSASPQKTTSLLYSPDLLSTFLTLHLLVHLFIKNVLSTYCVPGPDRDVALMESNKINKYLETLIIVNTVKKQSKRRGIKPGTLPGNWV